MNREVTSVAKTPQKLVDSAAAVTVITQEDIRRSGVTSIPEALRLAPGIEVARIDANRWAVSARGFNGLFANKLLVLIDGRSVYTPTFSGVFWEVQDLLLEDIERIEVIRGPGASLWGANAVNGIINILTQHARDTQGGLLSLTAGDEERAIVGLRYGAKLGDNAQARAYGKVLDRDGALTLQGQDAGDDWRLARGGFRIDWGASSKDALLFQGDLYHGDFKRNFALPSITSPNGAETVLDDGTLSGHSLQARWEHSTSPNSRTTLGFYYQHEQRDDLLARYHLDTFDLDFQHELALTGNQEFIWGLGYRLNSDTFDDAELIAMRPPSRDYSLFSGFAQDRINLLADKFELTFGSKIEHNDFTGWEFQPSLRALWKPDATQRVWAAVSRATRTPSRADNDVAVNLLAIPNPPTRIELRGSEDFASESVIAYELGYRAWPLDNLYFDLAAFYNDYDDLRFTVLNPQTATPGLDAPIISAQLINGEKAQTYGLELAADWRPRSWWRMQLAYSYLRTSFERDGLDPHLAFPLLSFSNNRDPRHQASLRSSFNFSDSVEFDVWLRYVSRIDELQIATLNSKTIDDYLTLDLRLGWRPSPNFDLSLIGRNLLDSPRLEYLLESNPVPTKVERSIFATLRWRF
ncbi:MAG: TonB-dependent receptor [Gammaproteobacteria bacterium]